MNMAMCLRQIYEYGQNWDEAAFANANISHDELSTEMELMSEFEEKLDKLNPVHVVGLFSIEARSLKSSLQPVTEKALSFMKRLLWKLMKEHVRFPLPARCTALLKPLAIYLGCIHTRCETACPNRCGLRQPDSKPSTGVWMNVPQSW